MHLHLSIHNSKGFHKSVGTPTSTCAYVLSSSRKTFNQTHSTWFVFYLIAKRQYSQCPHIWVAAITDQIAHLKNKLQMY